MGALWYSIALVWVGPMLLGLNLGFKPWRVGSKAHSVGTLLIAGVLAAVALPAAYPAIGPAAFGVFGGAFAVALLLAKFARAYIDPQVVSAAALGAFLVHALIDGATLFSFGTSPAVGTALAIDRVALGLFAWLSLRPRFGTKMALVALFLIGVATLVGYGFAGLVSSSVSEPGFVAGLQCLLTGLVFYLALGHQHDGIEKKMPRKVTPAQHGVSH